MSSNGISNSSNIPQDMQPPSNSGRYNRGGGRRGNRRGSQERGGSNRGYRRGGYGATSPSRNVTPVSGVINIEDSSEWPSVQESSSGSYQRQRSSHPVEAVVNQTGETSAADSRSFDGNRVSSYSRSQQNLVQGNNSMGTVSARDYGRFGGSRGRGNRYSQGRGYSGNYNKRYSRGGYGQFPGSYRGDHPMYHQSYFNGQIIFQAFPTNINIPNSDNRPQTHIDPVKQVEYYFSASNLENDVFMRAHMDPEGWVDLKVIHQFKRISSLNLTLEVLTEKLTESELLDIDVEKKRIRTKLEPERWYLPEGKRYVPPKIEQASNYDQMNNVGLAPMGHPYGAVQPMFIPVQGYGRGSSRPRYMQQYGFYPAYGGYSGYDVPESYYYPPEGGEQFGYDPSLQVSYYGVGGRNIESAEGQYLEEQNVQDQGESSGGAQEDAESVPPRQSDVDSLVEEVAKLDVKEPSTSI